MKVELLITFGVLAIPLNLCYDQIYIIDSQTMMIVMMMMINPGSLLQP